MNGNPPVPVVIKPGAARTASDAGLGTPSQETPGSVLVMARALLEAGVTPAAIAVVVGHAELVSDQLISAKDVAKITFTGSIPIGKRLAAAAGAVVKPVTMELGGHAPVIVCGDVDPEQAADMRVRAKFTNAGQICLCPSRFFVEEPIPQRFTERFVEGARALRVGEPIRKVLPIAPSTYRAQVARRSDPAKLPTRAQRDAAVMPEFARVFEENFRVYGVRKVWRHLKHEGHDLARCTVARLMRGMGLQGVIRGKPVRTTISDKLHLARWTT